MIVDTEQQGRWALPALVLLGLALRLYGAARAGLTFDESMVWAFAREITVSPVLQLASRTADHPLLNAYLARASSLAFGDGDLGLRPSTPASARADRRGVRLARMLGSCRRPGAAGLLAVDPFHVSWSRLIIGRRRPSSSAGLALLLWARCAGTLSDFLLACLCRPRVPREGTALLPSRRWPWPSPGARGQRARRTPLPVARPGRRRSSFVGLDLALTLGRSHWQRAPGSLGHPLG